MWAVLTLFCLSLTDGVVFFYFFFISQYETARINIFPLATVWGLDGCVVTDGPAAKQWAVATAT